MIWKIYILFISITGLNAVEVHFETPDSGFFLKHSPRQTSAVTQNTDSTYKSNKSKINQDAILSVDRFTIVQTTQPVSIRASYGPFSTKQTVPARYIVPDTIDSQGELVQNASAALLELQQSNVHLDISAHLVKTTIPRDSPVLRVLFHAGADPGGHLQRQKICVLLHVSMGTKTPLKGRCMPEGEDGVCVAEVIIPSNWWPSLPPPDKDGRLIPPKVPLRKAQISYSVFEPPARNPEQCEPKVQIQPLTTFVQIPLVPALTAYKELRADDILTILIPHQPLYPMSRIHVPVFLQPQVGQNIAVFIVRARVKAGMRILGATASSDQWNISVEKENQKHTVARVTAFRKDQDPDSTSKGNNDLNGNQVIEVFSWLIEVANDTKEHYEGGRIAWSVSYVHDGPKVKDLSTEGSVGLPEENRKRLVANYEILKDDIQAVLPISKNWELMNTAVLTGRQVSQAMKVFIVSQGGKVADVTLQSSCHAEDESVIKVSSSCSSVYVDGSEARGSSNASVIVKYGTYVGLAKFTVWMPEFPLEVSVSDFRLSQVKGWKIPEEIHNSNHGKLHYHRRRKRGYSWTQHAEDLINGVAADRLTCRARYQQSPVEVYARFLATDQDSGRVSYLISRRTGLRVTDLVQPLLRVADPKIASLRGRTLQGRAMGRTDIQVLSPITGRVIGAKEIRVVSDKVTITRLIVRVVSGLQLTIAPDGAIENGYIAETSVTRKLTAQYQEGLLDIDLEFSDGSKTPLREISVDDYFLLVESLDTEVVAFAPMLASHHPRVIAVGEGNGDLLRVTLLLSEECRLRRNIPLSKQVAKSPPGPLATSLAAVQVDFNTIEAIGRPDTVQNDGILGKERKGGNGDHTDLEDILIGGLALKDDSNHEPTVQARQHRSGIAPLNPRRNHPHTDMTSLEIGMYVLLTAFCFAIVVFVVSCIVYASKFRTVTLQNNGGNKDILTNSLGIMREPRKPRESTTNAHDWVWLGRSTMDRSSLLQDTNGNLSENQRDSRIRITSNPMNLNYSDPDDALVQATSFDNPNHIQLPLTVANQEIDSSTYVKRERNNINGDNEVPPPLPPHSNVIVSANNINNSVEFRPPVPPHKNVGVTAKANINDKNSGNNNKIPETVMVPKRHRHHHGKHHRSASNSNQIRRSFGNATNNNININEQNSAIPMQLNQANVAQHNLNLTQNNIIPVLYHMNDHQISQQPYRKIDIHNLHLLSSIDKNECTEELHMAEKLVENAAKQKKNAFQFDTITPQRDRVNVSDTNSSGNAIEQSEHFIIQHIENNATTKNASEHTPTQKPNDIDSQIESNSDDNGGFVTPPSGDNDLVTKNRVKRATVVGNPMFSNNEDTDLGPVENLGLDDMDMDYEQIMNYFDNLKESNA